MNELTPLFGCVWGAHPDIVLFETTHAMHSSCRRDHLGIPGAKRRRLNEDLEAARVLSSLPFTRQLKRELFNVVSTIRNTAYRSLLVD